MHRWFLQTETSPHGATLNHTVHSRHSNCPSSQFCLVELICCTKYVYLYLAECCFLNDIRGIQIILLQIMCDHSSFMLNLYVDVILFQIYQGICVSIIIQMKKNLM